MWIRRFPRFVPERGQKKTEKNFAAGVEPEIPDIIIVIGDVRTNAPSSLRLRRS